MPLRVRRYLLSNAFRVWFSSMRRVWPTGTTYLRAFFFFFANSPNSRDCVQNNILMDADSMYPEGFHPIALRRTPDYSGIAKYSSRTASGAKYYYVDFGISVHIPEALRPKLVTGTLGRDQDPPELSATVPYDPFKLDIFIIGNMFKREFHRVGAPRRCRSTYRLKVV